MKKIVLSALVLVTLAACGKGGAEKYVGYWQEKDDKYVRIVEIKKEGGQYFLDRNILSKGERKPKPYLLTEKDGELVHNNGLTDVPLKLSDDGNSLFVSKNSYQKIDAATKDKLVAHEESCRKLADEYFAEDKQARSGKSIFSDEYKSAEAAIKQKYKAQFAELQKESKCNNVPFSLEHD